MVFHSNLPFIISYFFRKKNKYVIISEDINKDKLVTILNGLDIYFKSIILLRKMELIFQKRRNFGKILRALLIFQN